MATYAGHYAEALIDLDGDALISTPVKVYLDGSSTLAVLYSDRTKSLAASNPATTSARGNLEIFADPGDYEGAAVVGGVEQSRFPIVVGTDPAEASGLADGGVTTAKLADEAVTAVKLGDASVTDAKVAPSAAISESKLALASDAAAAVASRRTLGTGPNQAVAGNDARLTDGRPPSGPAGGALSGTYPNPDIADGSVANAKLTTNPLARANHTGTQTAATVSDFDTQVRTSRPEQLATPTGALAMGGQKITGLGTPTDAADAASKGYADGIASGFHALTAAATASTANLTLSGEQTIDGVLTSASRVLVKNQTAPAENGVYVSAAGAWARATDADSSAELVGAQIFVSAGTVNALTTWTQQTPATITVGTTPITWAQSAASGSTTAGAGLTKTGNTIDVIAADGTLTVAADSVKVATGGITGTEIAAAIKDPAAGTPGLRTLGTGATQAAAGNDSRLSDGRAPSGAAGGDLTGTYPNPELAAGAVGGAEVNASIKDPGSGVAGLRTLGQGSTQAAAGNDARLFDARPPTGAAGGVLSGSYPNPAFGVDMATQTELDAHTGNGAIHGGGGGGSGYSAVMDEGVARTARGTLNFVGLGVTASDDATNARTVINIPGGAATAGDNPVNTIFNVKSPAYGAVGDGIVNDAAAIQAAIDDAHFGAPNGGIVYFPAGIYRINSTLIWRRGTSLHGGMGVGTVSDATPNISWGGADGGTMIETDVINPAAVNNRPWMSFKRLALNGSPTGGPGTVAGRGIHFKDRLDLGTSLIEAAIFRINGDAIRADFGGINFEVHGSRFDTIRDWAIRWTPGNRSDRMNLDQFTFDNNPMPSNPTLVPGGGGLLLMDGSANGNNAQFHLSMKAAKLEVNKNLNGNAHGADVSGLIKFICNPFTTGNKQFVEGIFDDVWVQGGGGIVISEATNPTVHVSPSNSFVHFDIRACRAFPITGVPGYNNLLTGTSRWIAHAIVHPVTPRVATSPSNVESSAIELMGLANVRDLAVLGKYATPIISSTGTDWTEPVTLYQGWILEPPTNVQSPGSTAWLQVLANCTVGTPLSGVTLTSTGTSLGTLSDVTNVYVGHFITVAGVSYEVIARIPATNQIQVFPNWVGTHTGAAVTYTPLTTRTIFTMVGAATAPPGSHGTIGQIITNTADTGAVGQVILWKKNTAGSWTALTR